MWVRFGAIVTFIAGCVYWLVRGTIESWFFDQIIQISRPSIASINIVEYGPPVIFAAICFWLITRKSTTFILKPNANSLSINLGNGSDFERIENNSLYNLRRTFSIALKNNGEMYVSNCNFYVDILTPENVEKSYLFVGAITLNSKEERYIPIAYYDEAIPPHPSGSNMIMLCNPVSGGYWDAANAELPINRTNIITLRVTCKEQKRIEVTCKLWIDTEGKLKMEQA